MTAQNLKFSARPHNFDPPVGDRRKARRTRGHGGGYFAAEGGDDAVALLTAEHPIAHPFTSQLPFSAR